MKITIVDRSLMVAALFSLVRRPSSYRSLTHSTTLRAGFRGSVLMGNWA
jgi:hypothetical protein